MNETLQGGAVTPDPVLRDAVPQDTVPQDALSPNVAARPLARIALIPAGGVGARMGAAQPKQYLELAGRTLLEHAAAAFLALPEIDLVAVVVSPDDPRAKALPGLRDPRVRLLPVGGATRRDSVLAGLEALAHEARADAWVLVHDAARPGLAPEAVRAMLEQLADDPVGGLLALPVADTVKRAAAGRIERTEPREALWLAQTPQMFRFATLRSSLAAHPDVTDESQAIERQGLSARLLPGSRRNLKVTVPEDLELLAALWANR